MTCSGSMSISSIDRVALPFTATALAATPEPRAANPSLATGGAGATRAPGRPLAPREAARREAARAAASAAARAPARRLPGPARIRAAPSPLSPPSRADGAADASAGARPVACIVRAERVGALRVRVAKDDRRVCARGPRSRAVFCPDPRAGTARMARRMPPRHREDVADAAARVRGGKEDKRARGRGIFRLERMQK